MVRTGPIAPVFGRRENGRLFIKYLGVWIWTRNGWRSRTADQVPPRDKARIRRRLRERKVWPWPTDVRLLRLLKVERLKAATGYENWTMGALPRIEPATVSDKESDTSDASDEENNEEDEV